MNDFDYLAQLPGEEREQRWLRERLETLSVREGIILAAAAQADPPENAAQAINQLQSLDEYTVRLDAGSYEELGRRYLLSETRVPQDALPFIDLESVGRQYEDRHPGLFIGSCYVQYPEMPLTPVYQPGMALPADKGWNMKLKVCSPAVPEGVWLSLPGPYSCDCKNTVEETLALSKLKIHSWSKCSLMDVRCNLLETGNLIEKYSGHVGGLIFDSTEVGIILDWVDKETPCLMERYAAALALEGCQDMNLAMDISINVLECYDWIQCADLEASGKALLLDAGVSEEQIRASGIDLAAYKAYLLEKEGYTPTADGSGYIRRNANEFYRQYSTPAQPQEELGMTMQ